MDVPLHPFGRRFRRIAGLALVVFGALLHTAHAAVRLPDGFSDEVVVSGLTQPVGMTFLPDGRLLVVEQETARVRLVANGTLLPDVGMVPAVNDLGGERGLLGIAVDPGWPARPYLYVHATSVSNVIRISRFTCTGDLAFHSSGVLSLDPATRRDLIDDIPDNDARHNGGTLRFGPDGMLYASLGEDAAGCPAQDSTALLGKILRLDVTRVPAGPGTTARSLITPADNPFVGAPNENERLVWALGLRNPFRFDIDQTDGVLYIGDVGENIYEELDRADRGGLNFGWPMYEADRVTGTTCPGPPRGPFTPPIRQLSRISGQPAAVIAACIYRPPHGATTPFPTEYQGDFFYCDYYEGALRRLEGSGDSWDIAPPVAGQPADDTWGDGFQSVSQWRVGPDGALWLCRQSGTIERIVPPPAPLDTTHAAPPVAFDPPHPLPSDGAVELTYNLPVAAPVTIEIFDMNGRHVRWLVKELQDAGPHLERWDGRDGDGRDARSGFYVVRLAAGSAVLTRRIVLVR